MAELKPCPFCGGEAAFIGETATIKCKKCGGAVIVTNPFMSRMESAEAWNRRAHADVVEVVRCKDCKHFSQGMAVGICYRVKDKPFIPCCYDHFCSYGERRTEEGTE